MSDGKDVIPEIEIQGILRIKKQYDDALLLFVISPNVAELRRRLVGRGRETERAIDKRCAAQLHETIMAAHNTSCRNRGFIENIRTELEGEK